MFFLRICLMAMRSLWIHPLRSFLATLGVIFGVGAVVAAMAILEGMGARIEAGFASMGSNKLFIAPNVDRRSGRIVGNFESLKLEDAKAVEKECPGVKLVMPTLNNSSLVKFLSKNTTAAVLGATENYTLMNSHSPVEGAFFTATDVQGSSRVAVLGWKVKKELFGGRPAIDEKIKISGTLGVRTFTVVGVMEEKGNVAFTDVDRQVIIPITTAMDIYGAKAVNTILCESVSPSDDDVEKAKAQIKKLLRTRHRIRAGQQDDFQVQAQKEFVEQFGTFRTLISIVLGSIAGISLAVGGIGIMNIMLVAVTERTREIGVRMAMGAKRGDVLQQFLVEASFVSFLGGGLGVLVGWGLATTIEKATRIFETITSVWAIVVALLMATVVGIVSGIYPAWKASRLDPVEALRYE